jgi:hypothetical protein
MAWLYCLPIPVGRRGVFYSFKLFLPAFVVLWYKFRTRYSLVQATKEATRKSIMVTSSLNKLSRDLLRMKTCLLNDITCGQLGDDARKQLLGRNLLVTMLPLTFLTFARGRSSRRYAGSPIIPTSASRIYCRATSWRCTQTALSKLFLVFVFSHLVFPLL